MADCISREGSDADVKEAHDLDHFEAPFLFVRIFQGRKNGTIPCFVLGLGVIFGES